jgi:hypothetical protein
MSTPPTGEGVVFSGDGVSKSAAEIGERISALAASGAIVRRRHRLSSAQRCRCRAIRPTLTVLRPHRRRCRRRRRCLHVL